MAESVSVLLVSIAAVLTAIDQISTVLTTKKLWKQQQQLQQQLEIGCSPVTTVVGINDCAIHVKDQNATSTNSDT